MNMARIFYTIASSALAKQVIKDQTTSIVPMSAYIAPTSDDPEKYYPRGYRVLDCWQCFRAKGKMCLDKYDRPSFGHTGSMIAGDAFCCRGDYNGEYCAD